MSDAFNAAAFRVISFFVETLGENDKFDFVGKKSVPKLEVFSVVEFGIKVTVFLKEFFFDHTRWVIDWRFTSVNVTNKSGF